MSRNFQVLLILVGVLLLLLNVMSKKETIKKINLPSIEREGKVIDIKFTNKVIGKNIMNRNPWNSQFI